MKFLGLFAFALLMADAMAEIVPFRYRFGAICVLEDKQRIVLQAPTPVRIAIFPGGKTWPQLSLGENGERHVGNALIDPVTGRFKQQATGTFLMPGGITVAEARGGFSFSAAGKKCCLPLQQLGLDKARPALFSLHNAHIMFSSSADT